MRSALLNILIIPVQALAWLGRQGTRAIAALVFIGIVVPPIGNVLKPFVTEAIFLLLCISFMRVDISALHDHLRRPGIILAATGWTTLAVPLIFGVSCLVARASTNIHRICFWGSCCRLWQKGTSQKTLEVKNA